MVLSSYYQIFYLSLILRTYVYLGLLDIKWLGGRWERITEEKKQNETTGATDEKEVCVGDWSEAEVPESLLRQERVRVKPVDLGGSRPEISMWKTTWQYKRVTSNVRTKIIFPLRNKIKKFYM